MATETIPFSPFWTQQNGLDAKIIDRNLAAIKQALDTANATIIRQQTVINRLVTSTTVNNTTVASSPPAQPMADGAEDGAGDTIRIGPPGENLVFSTGLTKSGHVVTANLSTGIAGGQSVVGGTGSAESLTYSSTTHGTKGLHIWGTTLGMTYNEANGQLLLGTTSPAAGVSMELVRTQNSGTSFLFVNESAGASAYTSFEMGQSSTLASGAAMGMYLFSSGSTFGLPYGANIGLLQLSGGSSNMHFWIAQNSGDFVWYTKATFPSTNERFRIRTGGEVDVASLAAGGIVKAAAATGRLQIAVANTDYVATARALTAGAGLTGGGDLSADRTFNVGQNADGSIVVNADDIQLGSYALVSRATSAGPNTVNLGAMTGGLLYHGVSGAISTPGNLNGTAGSVVYFSSTGVPGQDNAGFFFDSTNRVLALGTNSVTAGQKIKIAGDVTLASATNLTWDPLHVAPGTLSLSGSTTPISIARGLATAYFGAPTITAGSAITVDRASTVYIANQPSAGGSVTLTDKYALFVDAGLSRFDGDGTHVFELPEDTNVPETFTLDRQVPVKVNGSTFYLFLYTPA